MPFTPSHVAAALPFVRTPLLTAAVVSGTVAPDIPYFVPLFVPRELSHSPLGAVTVDPAIAIVAVLGWWLLLREPVVDLLPRWLGERIPALGRAAWRPSGWGPLRTAAVLLASALVGIATHLIWDSFTHPGWVVDHLAVLRVPLGPLPVEKWLQHLSSITGLVVVGVWATRRLRRTPADPTRPTRLRPSQRLGAQLVFLGAGVAAGSIAWIAGMAGGSAPFDPILVFRVARIGIGVALAVAGVLVALWFLAGRPGAAAPSGRPAS